MPLPLDIITGRKVHLARLASKNGATGEAVVIMEMVNWIPRPKGQALKVLIQALESTGIFIKRSSFDAIAFSHDFKVDLLDPAAVLNALPAMYFIEIKTSSQTRVKSGFDGFFFALTENEISAAEQLGQKYIVILHNRITGEKLQTSVSEIVSRSKSSTWQISVQL